MNLGLKILLIDPKLAPGLMNTINMGSLGFLQRKHSSLI